jgi:hypothetical protein
LNQCSLAQLCVQETTLGETTTKGVELTTFNDELPVSDADVSSAEGAPETIAPDAPSTMETTIVPSSILPDEVTSTTASSVSSGTPPVNKNVKNAVHANNRFGPLLSKFIN